MKWMAVLAAAVTFGVITPARADTPAERLEESVDLLKSVMDAPDKGIPQDLLEKAHCIAIVPGVKQAAFVVGAKFGKGYMLCREHGKGGWSAPASIRIEGGSFGFQIGGSETDVLMLIMNDEGERSVLSSKFTLGGNAIVAAGPVGRDSSAMTDGQLRAKILSWSRSRGAFAGLALTGATLREDRDENSELYGRKLTSRQVLQKNTAVPDAAKPLVKMLNRLSRFEE